MKWNFFTHKLVDKAETEMVATVNFSNRLEGQFAEFAEQKMLVKLVDKAVELWIEENGAELLKRITPEEVEKRVKQTIAERVLKA